MAGGPCTVSKMKRINGDMRAHCTTVRTRQTASRIVNLSMPNAINSEYNHFIHRHTGAQKKQFLQNDLNLKLFCSSLSDAPACLTFLALSE